MLQHIKNLGEKLREELNTKYKSLRQRIKQSRRDWQHPDESFDFIPNPRVYEKTHADLKVILRKILDTMIAVANPEEKKEYEKISEEYKEYIVNMETKNLMQTYWTNRGEPDSNFGPEEVSKIMHSKYGLRGGKKKTAKSNTKNVVKKSKNVNNAKKPASKKPTAKKPATKKPAAKKPATKKPAAKKSATAKSKLKK